MKFLRVRKNLLMAILGGVLLGPIAYSSAYQLIWSVSEDVSQRDLPLALEGSPDGGLFLVSRKYDQNGVSQFARFTKLDSDGNVLSQSQDLTTGTDSTFEAHVGKTGVYVNGLRKNGTPYYVFLAQKYDFDGNLLWSREHASPYPDNAYGWEGGVDADDNFVVMGMSGGIGGGDYGATKYDKDGNFLWHGRYNNAARNSHDYGQAGAVDPQGNAYLTGWSYGVGTGLDVATVKFDSATGAVVWAARYEGAGNDSGHGIAVDTFGNVYVTGSTQGTSDTDALLLKYDASGSEQWAIRLDVDGNDFLGRPVLAEGEGAIYLSGYTGGVSDPNERDALLSKFDLDSGALIWERRYSGNSSAPDNGVSLRRSGSKLYQAINDCGNGTVTYFGFIFPDPADCRGGVLVYDSQGNLENEFYFEEASSVADLVVSGSSVYVTGERDIDSSNFPFNTTNLYVAKFGEPDSDGDGVLDSEDRCPNLPGLAEFQGCLCPEGKLTVQITPKGKAEPKIVCTAPHALDGLKRAQERTGGVVKVLD